MPKYRVYFTLDPAWTDVEADTPEKAMEEFKRGHHVDTTSIQPLKEYLVKYKVITTYETCVEATSKEEAIKFAQYGEGTEPEEIDESYTDDFVVVELTEEE